MKFKSIFQKIMIPMALIVCFLGTVILGIVGVLFTGTYEQQIYERNNDTANFVSQSVGGFMNMAYRVTEQMAYMDDILSMNTQIQTPILEDTAKRNDYFELIYIQDMNGDQTGRSSGELGNRANRWWFTQMLETGEPFVSKSYYSVNTNMACASIFIPLRQQEKEIGILATDIKLDKLQEAVSEFSDINAGSVSFIIDGEGVVVAHPEKIYYEELYNYQNMTRTVTKKDEYGNVLYDGDGNILTEELPIEISPEYKNMIKEVMAGRSGQGLITDDEKEYYISYAPIPMDGISDSWSVISLQEKATAMQLMDRILRSGILATIATVVLAVILIFLLTRTITKPIQYCLKRLTDLSKGDLSTELPAIKGRDEISQLLEAVGNTIETLKKIIDDITEQLHRISDGDLTNQAVYVYSKDFNGLGQSLGAISLSLNQSLKRVSAHSAEVLANAATLSQTAQSLAKDTELQENAVEKLASEIENTSGGIRGSAEFSQKLKEKMSEVRKTMSASNRSAQELLQAMNLIQEDSQKIIGIAKTIQDISVQTNLLALNASVEAARAGKAGVGFSVIASEIRDLALHCSEAVENTEQLIGTTLEEIAKGMDTLNVTVDTIHNSVRGIQEANDLIEGIAKTAEIQTESMNQISATLEQISNVVQNNSAVAQETASSSIEMQGHAHQLQHAVQKYRF